MSRVALERFAPRLSHRLRVETTPYGATFALTAAAERAYAVVTSRRNGGGSGGSRAGGSNSGMRAATAAEWPEMAKSIKREPDAETRDRMRRLFSRLVAMVAELAPTPPDGSSPDAAAVAMAKELFDALAPDEDELAAGRKEAKAKIAVKKERAEAAAAARFADSDADPEQVAAAVADAGRKIEEIVARRPFVLDQETKVAQRKVLAELIGREVETALATELSVVARKLALWIADVRDVYYGSMTKAEIRAEAEAETRAKMAAARAQEPFGSGVAIDAAVLPPLTPLPLHKARYPRSEVRPEPVRSSAPAPARAAARESDARAVAASASSMAGAPAGKDAAWLREQCARVAAANDVGTSGDELAMAVHEVLAKNNDATALQSHLFELLGMNGLDLIPELIGSRDELVANWLSMEESDAALAARLDAMDAAVAADAAVFDLAGLTGGSNNPHGAGFTITSAAAKAAAKERRRIERRRTRQAESNANSLGGSGGVSSKAYTAEAIEARRQAKLAAARARPAISGSGSLVGAAPVNRGMPSNATEEKTKEYRRVHVPAARASPPGAGERLIPISEFEPWARLAFKGYKSLNRIQSAVFEAAYRRNENLLICAPTGAGKTNVALMTILHQVGVHMDDAGVIRRANFKIVYVAPMKALASEVVASFSKRLRPLGLVVKELTGDMQLTRRELMETQMIVTTPEKWDVITRKSGDMALTALVKLLIFDEVHLLHDDRGPVIESLVARSLRQVEATQSMIRIVGLSATLPNYKDVAHFLGVNERTGLFHFDASYRPVPLEQTFIGVREKDRFRSVRIMNRIAYEEAHAAVAAGFQVLVFVHARKDTFNTAEAMINEAARAGTSEVFLPAETQAVREMAKRVSKSKNAQLQELFSHGFGCHHAGMLRPDRNLAEKLFEGGFIKVMTCTATLAWGVNLPAQTVIIKGTQVYNADAGGFRPLSMLDVNQIFGRAGRPQYEATGSAIMITSSDEMPDYLRKLTHQLPIESRFMERLPTNLNAEIVLGTVTNVAEAISWLRYTYLYVRMIRNPLVYGIPHEDLLADPSLFLRMEQLIVDAARRLDACRMIRYDERTTNFYVTDYGRTASHYYIECASMEHVNKALRPGLDLPAVLVLLAKCAEFEQIKVRADEAGELATLAAKFCPVKLPRGLAKDDPTFKVLVLLQTHISGGRPRTFSLISDTYYVTQNGSRLVRGLFDMSLKRGFVDLADMFLTLGKSIEKRLWVSDHPLRQFRQLRDDVVQRLEETELGLDALADMGAAEIGAMIHMHNAGAAVARAVGQFPHLALEASVHPVTASILRVKLFITPAFQWADRVHGGLSRWWIWVQDADSSHIYHSEMWALDKRRASAGETAELEFTVPLVEPRPSQYFVRAISDDWLGAEVYLPLELDGLVLPDRRPPHTPLLDLVPLATSALSNLAFEALYPFSHFNPIQTQAFHTLYHTDTNVLLGAPTGSGKTICAELAMLRLFSTAPNATVVYVAPLKALVRERMVAWRKGLCSKLGKSIVELTGDVTPDARSLARADIVITTPEKWDGVSRNWKQRPYVRKVGLVVIDEIHLLGADRGPILEVIVSRMNYIAQQTSAAIRIVGLSTALANATDLADWLGIEHNAGLYNFRPSVRPVPLEVHIAGFPGKHYCPRMATMNKPTYDAIMTHSPSAPALVFVSSRRQTRLTAQALISACASAANPHQFLGKPFDEMEAVAELVYDSALASCLRYGIGMHHAGLKRSDKDIVEQLFADGSIQVLGTQFYDAKVGRYVDFPITDVLQMMGRAGRPQFDTSGIAVVLVAESKKNFYKKFLYEPFPVESSLLTQLHDHLNAEVVGGTISSPQDAMDYLTWTFLFRRLAANPSYYGLEDTSEEGMAAFLSDVVARHLDELEEAQCVALSELDNGESLVEATPLGRIASYYYLHYTTMGHLAEAITDSVSMDEAASILADATEFAELPVRHNEDALNAELAKDLPWPTEGYEWDDPHAKAFILLQAHMGGFPLPISDYITDLKSILDQSARVLQAMVDVAAQAGYLATALTTMRLAQGIVQARFPHDSSLLQLPGVKPSAVESGPARCMTMGQLQALSGDALTARLQELGLGGGKLKEARRVVSAYLPKVAVKAWIKAGGKKRGKGGSGRVGVDSLAKLKVSISMAPRSKRNANKAYAPRFPRPVREGWWIVVGLDDEILALKRVGGLRHKLATELEFYTPDVPGDYTLTVHLVSDCYMGLDQCVEVSMVVA
ncbi:activating signal cointegrator 1 complex subunit 3 [Thecamonas trahens ATCC 50062]|uniref:Activating signal cointegrator 1 complex subunit 3 n=1 Tax=Thecamonas trahens ATCC 50062 TaxID=461836 RepID=A0A0L0DG16_THETB|nr:activating signal cointegrator 1 complex subunit 3 [Thecamonas trahens ATCC 50062]KNC51125.1 activating signal cointegrator 1 complex subunit 3 [Thecamonas trahens ATCC 50062]|eukprot:XP_013756333.1 activating signal cointegrator 1 complex subunit 3 [Thecamonas trahens ATCC 50062]